MSYCAHKLFALSRNGEKSENPVMWPWPLTYDFQNQQDLCGGQSTCSCKVSSSCVQRFMSYRGHGEKKLGRIGVLVMVHLGGQDQICPNFRHSPLRPRSSAVGARIETPKALRGVGCGEGVSPSPWGRGFRFLSSKRRVLVHLWCYFLQLINFNLHIQIAKTFI